MPRSRRETLAAAAAALIAGPAAADGPRARPNILWLVSEDNNPFVGAYGDRLAHTPNIDRLAREGVLFRNAFSNAPVCAPSRFGILTGCYPETCAPANHMRAVAKLPAELRTYPEYLRAAGYYCTNNEKTDYNCDVRPERVWDESSAKAHWRNRPAGQPFMAVFNFMTSHESQVFQPTPGRVTPDQVRIPAYLPDTPLIRGDYASYYNVIEKMDGQLGEKLAELEAAGLADDTIVFYYSDNGGVLPRSKRFPYDEGFRCCLVVRVPPKWRHLAPGAPGSEVADPVSFIDLAPTLLAIAGQPRATQMQGAPFMGPGAVARRRFVFGMRNRMDERYDFIRTATDGRYRYIRNYMPHRPMGQNVGFAWLLQSYQDWEREHLAGRLNAVQDRFFQEKPFEEFYDLATDRDEVRNLIGEPAQAARIGQFRDALDAHMLRIHDNGFIPEGGAAEGYHESRDRRAYPLPQAMRLAAMAARRDPRNLAALSAGLAAPNEVLRYWAASGLLMLGEAARPALPALRRLMGEDPSASVQVVAAEAVVRCGEPAAGVARLAAILDQTPSMPVTLQALNALTFIGAAARPALPQARRAAEDERLNVRTAGRYLTAMLEGTYKPGFPSFDLEALRRAAAA